MYLCIMPVAYLGDVKWGGGGHTFVLLREEQKKKKKPQKKTSRRGIECDTVNINKSI